MTKFYLSKAHSQDEVVRTTAKRFEWAWRAAFGLRAWSLGCTPHWINIVPNDGTESVEDAYQHVYDYNMTLPPQHEEEWIKACSDLKHHERVIQLMKSLYQSNASYDEENYHEFGARREKECIQFDEVFQKWNKARISAAVLKSNQNNGDATVGEMKSS
eukprot:10555309-Ditylum_brightwellii.AAC.1